MPRNFSGPSNGIDAAVLAFDQAPAAPTLVQVDANTFQITCPITDFDGTPLTPNGSGSSGCDNAYLCGAFYNADGSNPLDTLGGADAYAQYGLHTATATPGEVISAPFNPSPVPGGAMMKLVAFVSDGVE